MQNSPRDLFKSTLLAVSIPLLVTSCVSNNSKPNALACEGHANYEVVFNSTWSKDSHPEDIPDNPHLSNLFGVSHNNQVSFWEQGAPVSEGVKNIAERGSGYKLIKEAEWAIKIDHALDIFDGQEIKHSPGSSIVQFQLTKEFPQVTLVNMLAPSPDWITGVSSLNLCENGKWVETKVIPAEVYDAGTDDGRTYTAEDKPRNEFEPVVLLRENDRSDYAKFPPVGTYHFTKIGVIDKPEGAGYVKHIRMILKEAREDRLN
jgi:hypothetical protein